MSKMSHLLSNQNSQQPKQFRGGEKKVMKKSLSLLVAIAMVFSMFASMVSAADKTAGETLKDLGIITGTSEGLQEDAEWLRKDVTILLSRLYGAEETAKAYANTHGFADLDAKGYNGYVSWAKEKGLFNGKSATEFGPNDAITYYQFATVILRALGQEQEKFEDNLAKAIELGLFAEGTVGTDNAVRGNIYSAVVSALDVKVDGKKLGTILGLKGYQITDLELVSASAVVASKVVLTFNDDVKTIGNDSVTITDKDGSEVLVEEAKANGDVVTVSLASSLTSGETYTVSVASAASEQSELKDATATFTYKKGEIATVAIKDTTITTGNKLEIVAKDAAGNDITADYSIANDFDVKISDNSIINSSLEAIDTGDVIVNVTVEDSEITTGNVIVTVKDAKAISIVDVVAYNVDGEEVALDSLTKGVEYKLVAEVQREDKTDMSDAATITYVSRNAAVVVADSVDASVDYADITTLQTGTATVVVTAKLDGYTATKSVVLTVKAAAKLDTASIDKTSSVVDVNGADDVVTVKLLDQYGKKFNDGIVEVKVTGTKVDVDAAASTNVTNGSLKIALTGVAAGTDTVTITVKDGSTTKKTFKVSVRVTNDATVKGYVVSASAATLESNGSNPGNNTPAAASATVSVYNKNAAGAKLNEVTNNVDVVSAVSSGSILVIDGQDVSAVANKVGKEKVNVKLNGVVIGSVEFEVVATSLDQIAKVVQNKTSISVSKSDDVNIENKLVSYNKGTTSNPDWTNGAFTAYNKYDSKVNLDFLGGTHTGVEIFSSNQAIVGNNGDLNGTGKATLTVKINGAFYTINVNVLD